MMKKHKTYMMKKHKTYRESVILCALFLLTQSFGQCLFGSGTPKSEDLSRAFSSEESFESMEDPDETSIFGVPPISESISEKLPESADKDPGISVM